MGHHAQSAADVAVAIGPVAVCLIVLVPCVAIFSIAWLARDVANQIVAKAKVARVKRDGLELEFHPPHE